MRHTCVRHLSHIEGHLRGGHWFLVHASTLKTNESLEETLIELQEVTLSGQWD
jgi:hypothetical protein